MVYTNDGVFFVELDYLRAQAADQTQNWFFAQPPAFRDYLEQLDEDVGFVATRTMKESKYASEMAHVKAFLSRLIYSHPVKDILDEGKRYFGSNLPWL